MAFNQVAAPVSSSVRLTVIFKCLIELIVCISIILVNILIITTLFYVKRLRTTQNLLLINVSVTCILFSLSCILSASFTISTLYSQPINSVVCRCVGFLIIASCHCLMFSYLLVTLVRFLTIIYPFNRRITSIESIAIYLLFQWILGFLLPGISSLFFNQQIIFQPKAKFCSVDQRSPILFIIFCTGYIIPLVLISLINLITYWNVIRSRQAPGLSLARLSRVNKRKRRNLRLLRQFSVFTVIFVFGWTPFILVEVFDKDERLPDALYLFTLLLPPMCVLLDSHVLLCSHKTISHQVCSWWRALINRSERTVPTRNDLSVSGQLSYLCIDSNV